MGIGKRITGRRSLTGGVLALMTGWTPGIMAAEDEVPLDLGASLFSVARWSYEQEMSARIIREACEVPYSDDATDRDKEEIDQYLLVTAELRVLGPGVSRDQTNELAMKHGLTLGRYNEITQMIELFPSVSSAFAARGPSQGFRPPTDFAPDWSRLASVD